MYATPIKPLAAILVILTSSQLAAAPVRAQSAPTSEAASLTVSFSGLKSTDGALMIALFASEAAYSSGQPVQALKIAADTPSPTASFSGLKPGLYAIKAFHDLNGDGKLNTNPFGVPIEPYAFSNGAQADMGPPTWTSAAFTVGAGVNTQTLNIE
jgi:uncharacterized protein (DUF2141 family)